MSEWLPKNLSKLGWLPERGRGPKGPQSWWIDLAKDVGEWTGYLLLAFVIIALLRRIPYRWFRLVPQSFWLSFIAAVFHGILLLPDPYWLNPLGWLTGLLAFAGLIPAYLSVTNRIGYNRQYPHALNRSNNTPAILSKVVCRPLKPCRGTVPDNSFFVDFCGVEKAITHSPLPLHGKPAKAP